MKITLQLYHDFFVISSALFIIYKSEDLMNIYEYIPAKDFKKISTILVILISAACGFFAFPAMFPNMSMKWIFQLSGIACLTGVIFVVSRYISKTVVYRIVGNEDEDMDFTVTELTNGGRSKITVCRFSLSGIESAELFYESKSEDRAKKKTLIKQAKKDGRKIFNYCADVKPAVVCCLLVEESGEKFLIKLRPDAVMYGYFQKSAEKS